MHGGPHAPAHVRLSINGTLNGGEIFSCNLSLKPVTNLQADPTPRQFLEGSQDLAEQIRQYVLDFWQRPSSHIHPSAAIRRIKFAAIKADGTYDGPALEFANNVGGAENMTTLYPNQIARKVTLLTAGDLGRVKGGFYIPGVTNVGFDPTTQLFNEETANQVQNSVELLLEEIEEEAPDLGSGRYVKVVVASAGRYNKDGSTRVPPALHDVKAVSCGRRLDAQRRRANKIGEARPAFVDLPD